MHDHAIRVLSADEAQARRPSLVELLIDGVESGAAVNFVQPMTRAKAEAWWAGALAAHARGERVILTAEVEGRVDGTVQLVRATQENQAFRADVAKLLVHTRAPRRGLGAALMAAVETEARRRGHRLLTLDTESDSAAERLYLRLGWTRFGQVPGYALRADGERRQMCSFFYKEL